MRNNYLLLHNVSWVSEIDTFFPIKYKDEMILFFNKDGSPDKRTKEYKQFMKDKPKGYSGIIFNASVSNIMSI